jgi:CRISPR/Cas system CSM-associated protein Csm2 small subunit
MRIIQKNIACNEVLRKLFDEIARRSESAQTEFVSAELPLHAMYIQICAEKYAQQIRREGKKVESLYIKKFLAI